MQQQQSHDRPEKPHFYRKIAHCRTENRTHLRRNAEQPDQAEHRTGKNWNWKVARRVLPADTNILKRAPARAARSPGRNLRDQGGANNSVCETVSRWKSCAKTLILAYFRARDDGADAGGDRVVTSLAVRIR